MKLLEDLKSKYEIYCSAKEDYDNTSKELEDILLSFPQDVLAKFVCGDDYNPDHRYEYNNISITPKDGTYWIELIEIHSGNIVDYYDTTIEEDKLVNFLNK